MRNSRWTTMGLALLAAIGGSACYDTDVSPPPTTVAAVFDPSGTPPQIPLPNDLTMQPASARATARAAFSGPLDPATVTRQTVVAIDLVTRTPLPSVPTVDPADPSAILISPIPGATWPLGHRIAIAVIGYPVGVQGEGGVPVVASPAFYFARGANPVATCATASPDCQSTTPALQQQQAIGLEQLRQALAPVIEGLVAAGFPRDALAIVWTFTVGAP